MGWLAWALETALCGLASWLTAGALFRERGLAHRAVVTLLVAPTLLLWIIQGCGMVGRLEPVTVGLAGALLFSSVGALAYRSLGRAGVKALGHRDLSAVKATFVDGWREREPALLGCVLGGFALVLAGLRIIYFKTWDWDADWYHLPITNWAIQTRSILWPPTHDVFIRGFPRNIEWLAVWNCLFSKDNRLDDSAQWPFALLGAAVVMAWARKIGASRPLSAGLGLIWVTLPPVYIQMDSSHNDLACGALLSAALYFCATRPERRDRWMAVLALGLYAGTKTSGLFHLAVLSPLLAARFVWEIWNAKAGKLRATLDVVLSGMLWASVGAFKYIENALRVGNPTYPFPLNIPVLGLHLPGPANLHDAYHLDPSKPLGFFGDPVSLERMWASWFESRAAYWPDVRTGGFGAVFRWLLLPCIVLAALNLLRRRDQWRQVVPVLVLFVAALLIPAPWWPRYTLGAASATLVAFALVHQELHYRRLRLAASSALVVLAAYTMSFTEAHREGPRSGQLLEAMRATPEQRATLRLSDWTWEPEWGLRREREFRAGDVFAHDEHIEFGSEYWTRDYRNRVAYVSSEGDPEDYLKRLRAVAPRWVALAPDTPAEKALVDAGAELLFTPPIAHVRVYRMPGF